MKYEIVKNGTDDYTLKFKNKEYNYKPDVELASKLQAAPKQARIEMLKDLAKDGISLKDFTIEEKKQGKTYFDNTNKIELEKTYIENKMLEIIDEVCKEKFNLDFTNLLIEIGLETQEEQELFAKELGATLTGKTPS